MKETDKTENFAEIIRKRKSRVLIRQGYVSLLFRVLFLVFSGWLLFTQVFFVTQVKGNEMFPAVKDGDLVIGFRLQQEYAKDDVIAYTVEDGFHIGRIAARGTDVVLLDESGTMLVNGTAQSGEIMYPTYAKEGVEYPLKVPESYMFLLGDYRTQAEDSRDFGPVSMKNVKGKVITILRRRGL